MMIKMDQILNKKLLFYVLILLMIVSNAQMISDHNGIYTLGKLDLPFHENTYAKPFVAGGAVRVTWKKLEPTEGNYDWSFLTNEILTAKNAGKRVSVFIKTDYAGTPDWLYESGANKYFYVDENVFHDTYGDTLFFPFPWDGVYIQKWINFIDAFGLEFGNDTTISYVRGALESVTNGWGLPNSDINGNDWQYYNYTTDTLINTMKLVLDHFMNAFPMVPHWLEVGPIKFEESITGKDKLYVASEILDYSLLNYANQTGIWREDMHCNVSSSPDEDNHWIFLKENSCRTGAQMVGNVSYATGLNRMRKCDTTMNSKQAMDAAIQKALEYKMPYLEIYKVDIVNDSLAIVLQTGADNLDTLCVMPLLVEGSTNEKEDYNLFPNPTTGKISLLNKNIKSIEIYNVFGQRIKEFINPHEINISKYTKGTYFIKIIAIDGYKIEKMILK